MLKKLSALLLFCIALFQIAYSSKFTETISKSILRFTDYTIFTKEIRSFVLFISLLVLLSVVFLFSSPVSNEKKPGDFFWGLGFWGILLIASLFTIYINPQGRFFWNKHSNYIELEVRTRKLDLYKQLERTPDLILFGSSVSFLAPMDYIEEKWGIKAFNMSVNGGEPADFVNRINTLKRISPNSSIPAVVMAEILNPGFSVNNLNQTPIEYIPDMATLKQQTNALWATAKGSIQIGTFSDALFTFYIIDRGRWNITATLSDNGTMLQSKEYLNDNLYKKSVEKNIFLLNNIQSCEKLNANGKIAFENLVQLSRTYKFSLVIYRTPINEDFYVFSGYKPSKYAACAHLFDEYMSNIAAENPNIFFKDLSQYKKIATGGKELYRDTHHLTAKGYKLVFETLQDEIGSAIKWAQENR